MVAIATAQTRYSFWLRINILCIIAAAAFGSIYFFDVIEYLVILKFTDTKVQVRNQRPR